MKKSTATVRAPNSTFPHLNWASCPLSSYRGWKYYQLSIPKGRLKILRKKRVKDLPKPKYKLFFFSFLTNLKFSTKYSSIHTPDLKNCGQLICNTYYIPYQVLSYFQVSTKFSYTFCNTCINFQFWSFNAYRRCKHLSLPVFRGSLVTIPVQDAEEPHLLVEALL